MGFVHSVFLVGVNEHINKKVNIYYHELTPMQALNSYSFNSSSKVLPNGMTLVENNYSFGDCFLRDDTVPEKESVKTEWTFKKYEPITRWLAGDNAPKHYGTRRFYVSHVSEDIMQLIINDMYNELVRLTNGDHEVIYKLVPMLHANNYQSLPVMVEIARISSREEAKKFVELIQKTEDMKLPVNDYQLLFDTMDRAS